MSTVSIVCKTAEDTFNLGRVLASGVKGGEVITLDGNLGAGKTVLVSGMGMALGVEGSITSPTFTLLHAHAPVQEGGLALHHFDAYRLTSPEEWYDSGFDEYIDEKAICVVEWGEIVASALPRELIKINIAIRDDLARVVTISWRLQRELPEMLQRLSETEIAPR